MITVISRHPHKLDTITVGWTFHLSISIHLKCIVLHRHNHYNVADVGEK